MFAKKIITSAVIGLGAVLVLTACGPVAKGEQGSAAGVDGKNAVTILISGDTNIQDLWEKGIIPAYKKKNPSITVKTTIDLHGEHDQQTIAKLSSATKAGKDPGYDLVDAGFVTGNAVDAGLLLKVDAATISGLASVPKTTVMAGKGAGIPYRASSVLLAYDSKKVKNPPKTLKELLNWIKANPGKFAYNTPATGGSGGAFVTTVLDSHLSQADQEALRKADNKKLEAGWDAGFKELKDLGPFVYQKGVYPNGNNQVLDLLGSGAIEMAPVWSDQFITAQKKGMIPETIAFTQISNPSFTGSASYLGIPKTSTHTKEAIDVVNFVLSPEGQTVISEQISGYPVVDLKKLPEKIAKKFADADPSALRPSYFAEITSDMNNEWDKRVP